MKDAVEGWQSIGPHMFRTEPPNIFHVRWGEIVTVPDLLRLYEAAEQFGEQYGERVFWIGDAAKLTKATTESRKVATDWLGRAHLEAHVTLNARFHIRVLGRLIFDAAQLLQPSKRTPRVAYVESEAEARAWIAREIERLGLQPNR